MSVVCAGTCEESWAVWALGLLVFIGVHQGAVQLHGFNTWEVTPAFRTAVPVFYQMIPENRKGKNAY